MSKQRRIYAARRRLRALERAWTAVERLVDRATAVVAPLRPYNPFYHLGTLTIFLLIYLAVTGLYLTIFYRPGSDRAYVSVAGISATWFGSLMRTSHRYASDMLILATFLHALKMFLSDRFWGSRWLAWTSGWVMVIVFWLIGTMGYFLVWDQAAQWLLEYSIDLVKGLFALSFIEPQSVARTFSFFVIILFLHVFVPIMLIIGVIVHVLRLARARYWSPRWLMILTVIALVAVSLAWPATSNPPADFTKLVERVNLDWWYLGFLPLSAYLGNPLFWGLSIALIAVLLFLPWLARGQHLGPAHVINPKCTGCALCARECPYNAIVMEHRDDDTPYSSIAIMKPSLCTGCGICVAACAYDAIELEALPSAVVRQDLRRTMRRAYTGPESPVVIYACDRHVALGTIPPLEDSTPVDSDAAGVSLIQAALPPRVTRGVWRDDSGERHPVMVAQTPCMGMLHPTWAAETIEAGAAGAIMVTCPVDDCAFREGPHWVEHRVRSRRTLRKGNTHLLEIAPGSRKALVSLWSQMVAGGEQAEALRHAPTVVRLKQKMEPVKTTLLGQARHLLPGLALLVLIVAVSALFWQPATFPLPEQAQIRVGIKHSGKRLAAAQDLPPEVTAKLPENVDPSTVLGGERFPVQLRLFVDGELVLENTYRPSGLRREGSSAGLETWWLPPGEHDIEIMLNDDGANWRTVYSQRVTIQPGEALILYYDDDNDVFVKVKP
ncbi:MAG: 4Fe-4S dicluster domain-containing protein [Chloroflexi bacterium]|nr:4Fe-4S dicluster domain-containing protein [Chloroflexota bacterium]